MTDLPSFDLRPILAQGIDPLQRVVETARSVAKDAVFILEAPFDPLPLRRVLSRMGFSSRAEKTGEGHWFIRCRRDGEGLVEMPTSGEECAGLPDIGAPIRREADGIHIDVRNMTAPRPLLAILRLCATLGEGDDVIVHHDRDPIYLYPELAELGWDVTPLAGDSGEVRLRLHRGGGA
jgi:hypothetical protein